MSILREIFSDDRKQLSSGRVFAAFCIIAALSCWVVGVCIATQQAHAQVGMQAFLTAAAGFYVGGKATERFGKQSTDQEP